MGAETHTLGFPPEFGADGAEPPRQSSPVVISESIYLVRQRTADSTANDVKLLATTRNASAAAASLGASAALAAALAFFVGSTVAGPVFRRAVERFRQRSNRDNAHGANEGITDEDPDDQTPEIRKVVHSQYWARDARPIQLPPGTSQEWTYTVTAGLAETRTQELAASLGLRAGIPIAQLTSELSTKFGLQVAVTAQSTRSETLTLRNDDPTKYQRWARWTVVSQLHVYKLRPPPGASVIQIEGILTGRTSAASEEHLLTVEIPDTSAPNLTSVKVAPQHAD